MPVTGPLSSAVSMAVLVKGIELKALRKEVSRCSKADWKNLLLQRAGKLVESVAENNSRSKFAILRAMKPYVPRKEHRLRNGEGKIVGGIREEQIVVKGHFASALGGKPIPYEHLIDKR